MNVSSRPHFVRFTDELVVVGATYLGELLEDLVKPVLENIERLLTSH